MRRDRKSKLKKNNRKPLAIACVIAAIAAHVAAADTINLKNSVRLAVNATAITLGDIAELDGAEAQQYASLPILQLSGATTAMEISIQDVRRKLTEAGAHWGRLSLSGRAVTVRPGRPGDAQPPIAMAALAIDSPRQRDGDDAHESITAAELLDEATLRGEIARVLAPAMHAQPEDVRFTFDATDADVLNTSVRTASDVRYEIQPLGSVSGDRIAVGIRVWSDGRAGERRTVNVQPQVRVKAAALTHDVPSDATLTSAYMESRETWLPPSQASMVIGVVQAAGGTMVRGMKAGDFVRANSLRRDAMIKRGDMAMVRCLVGGVVISMQAEARDDGAEGDRIEFRKPGERDTFTATVTARSEAVIDLAKK